MVDFSVKDKVVVITGGSGVIGGELASNFAQAQARVVVLNRSEDKIAAKVKELKAYTPYVMGIACDVMDREALHQTRTKILDEWGKIDVLINAAGGHVAGATQDETESVFDLDIDCIDQAIDLNMKGTIYPTLIFGEAIAQSGSGSIINISSMATYTAISRVMGYSVSKTGINSFTRWMASEMARKFGDKIRVNAIAPGFFIGEQNRKLLIKPDGSLTDRSKRVINKTPMGRFGEVKEISGAVQFLCSDAASFITGVVLPVDGGFSSYSGV